MEHLEKLYLLEKLATMSELCINNKNKDNLDMEMDLNRIYSIVSNLKDELNEGAYTNHI